VFLFSVVVCSHIAHACILFTGYLVGEGNIGLPDGRWWRFLYCSLINVVSLVVCLIGAGMFAKTSVMVLGVVCISLLSVIISFCIQSPMEVNAGFMISDSRCDRKIKA
jgi:potassium/chloride transporter 9